MTTDQLSITVRENGGPEVLTVETGAQPEVLAGHALVRVEAAGVNFIDTYQREGIYPLPLPFTPGSEGAGKILALGEGLEGFVVGQKVAWAMSRGSYTRYLNVPANDLFAIPEGLSTEQAAASALQGFTAHYLATSVGNVTAGDTVLIHAAAGGVGLLLTQLCKQRGATVIGTVSTGDKATAARAAGADHIIRYENFSDIATELPAAVRSIIPQGVRVVFDGVGESTFQGSLKSLAVRGLLALFGGASGQVPPFNLQELSANGSLSVTRPSLGHFLLTPEERAWRAEEIFGAIASGTLALTIDRTYPLTEAAAAHRALEGRETSGKVLLLPWASE